MVDTDRTADLDELMSLLTDGSDDTYGYSAAWFDTTTTGAQLGRAVLTRGSLATVRPAAREAARRPAEVRRARSCCRSPTSFPSGLANRYTLRAFSELWYRKAPKRQRGAIQNITAFYQVLDLFGDWNRVYGSRGFLQYQFLVPFGEEATFRRIVEKIAASPHASGLNVLKRFGAGNQAPLSFPQPGWTITVDFPIARGLHRCCDELDELVLGAGGRLYLAKESRTSAATFRRGYPRFDEWRKVRDAADPDGVFASDMSRTTGADQVIDAVGNPQSILLLGGTSEIGLAVVEAFATRPAAARGARRPPVGPPRRRPRPAGGARLRGGDAPVRRRSPRHPRRRGAQGLHRRRHRRRGRRVRAARRQRAGLDRRRRTPCELAQVNYTAAVSVGVALAERMREQGHGSIVAFSSVAGERARRSNFVYGSTKAGLDAFYSGLTEALRPHGVTVTVVRPGFVHTRMTEGMQAGTAVHHPGGRRRDRRSTPSATGASWCGRPRRCAS